MMFTGNCQVTGVEKLSNKPQSQLKAKTTKYIFPHQSGSINMYGFPNTG